MAEWDHTGDFLIVGSGGGGLVAAFMGRTYPGASASIANTATFGNIAARHAAAQPRRTA